MRQTAVGRGRPLGYAIAAAKLPIAAWGLSGFFAGEAIAAGHERALNRRCLCYGSEDAAGKVGIWRPGGPITRNGKRRSGPDWLARWHRIVVAYQPRADTSQLSIGASKCLPLLFIRRKGM